MEIKIFLLRESMKPFLLPNCLTLPLRGQEELVVGDPDDNRGAPEELFWNRQEEGAEAIKRNFRLIPHQRLPVDVPAGPLAGGQPAVLKEQGTAQGPAAEGRLEESPLLNATPLCQG